MAGAGVRPSSGGDVVAGARWERIASKAEQKSKWEKWEILIKLANSFRFVGSRQKGNQRKKRRTKQSTWNTMTKKGGGANRLQQKKEGEEKKWKRRHLSCKKSRGIIARDGTGNRRETADRKRFIETRWFLTTLGLNR